MRVKAIRGSDPTKLFDYLCNPHKQHLHSQTQICTTRSVQAIIFCRSIPGNTTLELARNFRLVTQLNRKVAKTIAHYSISLPLEDNDKVGSIEMLKISLALLERLGHTRCPYFGVEHHDTRHRHWHIAASTITYSGEWVSDSFDRYRLRVIEQEIEAHFGLTRSPIRPVVDVKNLSTGEYRLKQRSKKLLPKEKLWLALDECIAVSRSLARLTMELRVKYPEISIRLTEKQGEHVGISFEVDGIAFAGRKLGRAYSLNGLRRYHGIQYDNQAKALLDKILSLTHEECRALYDDIEREQSAQIITPEVHQIDNQILL